MRLSPNGKQLIERTLTAKVWTLEKLGEKSGIETSTIKKFSAGKDVSRITFVTLCQKLELDWETVVDLGVVMTDVISTSTVRLVRLFLSWRVFHHHLHPSTRMFVGCKW